VEDAVVFSAHPLLWPIGAVTLGNFKIKAGKKSAPAFFEQLQREI
jgi:hypothetical protein